MDINKIGMNPSITGKSVSNFLNKGLDKLGFTEKSKSNFKSAGTTPSDIVSTTTMQPITKAKERATSATMSDRAWAEQQSQRQMDFQREMSNTAYQRQVADLKRAGLNPALAYLGTGASVGAGSMAHTSSTEQQNAVQDKAFVYQMFHSALQGLVQVAGKKAGASTFINVH